MNLWAQELNHRMIWRRRMARCQQQNRSLQSTTVLFLVLGYGFCAQAIINIEVDPRCTRSIGGISELDRKTYFAICDSGTDFDRRCKDDEMYEHLVGELGVNFGRRLGVVNGPVKRGNVVVEDPNRPGYADLGLLKNKLSKKQPKPSGRFRIDMGENLDVAAHGQHNAYPAFMGKFTNEQAIKGDRAEYIPKNIDAAAELAAAVLLYGYSDFDRPAYYEPINEPHWSFYGDQHLADWHLSVAKAVHAKMAGVKVGGLCMSVAYMYRDRYRVFGSFKKFIDNTGCRLDFYSFHVYDYVYWKDGEFHGRITSGLPLEGVLDLVPNYTQNAYGKEVEIVVSEHGGYVTGKKGLGADETAETIAKQHFPGSGFEWELKKRSILEQVHVSTIVANTLTFMDHPHTVKKAVPFILLNSFGWDPKYYAVLYVPDQFKNNKKWIPTQQMNFYRFFKGLKGRRVKAICSDPDIQTRAFVDGDKLYVVLNNLSGKREALSVNMPTAKTKSIRRMGRNGDFTPYLREELLASARNIEIEGHEAILLAADYRKPILAARTVDETPCYGDKVNVALDDWTVFDVAVPNVSNVEYAVLRIGVSRAAGSDKRINVKFNGRQLYVPLETCHNRLDDGERDYASCKMIQVDAKMVRMKNTVAISFADGEPGSVGSVVLRAAIRK